MRSCLRDRARRCEDQNVGHQESHLIPDLHVDIDVVTGLRLRLDAGRGVDVEGERAPRALVSSSTE